MLRLTRLPLLALLFLFMFLINVNSADAGILKRFKNRHSGCSAASGSCGSGTSHAGRPVAAFLGGTGCSSCSK